MTAPAGQAPGVVTVRLSGEAAGPEHLAHLLTNGTGPAIEVIEESANRRDPGWRCYLTVHVTQGGR